MTSSNSHDIVVVGGGPGGYAAALTAASRGLSVALVERDRAGGTCLHRGCIPTKFLLETSGWLRRARDEKRPGIEIDGVRLDWGAAQAAKSEVVRRNWLGLTATLSSRGVETVVGSGTLTAGGAVRVRNQDGDERELLAGAVVLAPGSVPIVPNSTPLVAGAVATSTELLALTDLPDHAIVLGGGIVGCEFASMLVDVGVRVTLVELFERLLPSMDHEIAAEVASQLERRGVRVITGASAVRSDVDSVTGAVQCTLTTGEAVTAELMLVAVGRRPATEHLLEPGTGVSLDSRGFIKVDRRCRTGHSSVWAVGDAIASPALAHVAFAEGILAVDDIMGSAPDPIDYERVPLCVYTHPEAASVGLTEEDARAQGIDFLVERQPFAHNARAMIAGEDEGFVKLVLSRGESGKADFVLGAHIVGPHATELIAPAYLVVNWDVTVGEVASLLQPHPTLSEVFGEAALAGAGRPLHG